MVSNDKNQHLNELINFVIAKNYDNLGNKLEKLVFEQGIINFVEDYAAPFMRLIGSKWATGEIQVFEEHSVSMVMQRVLNNIIQTTRFGNTGPVILMCSVPGEWHTLGLQMVEAAFSSVGARCINFSGSLPTTQIVKASKEYSADIVSLSLSTYSVNKLTKSYLEDLRQNLDLNVDIWVGGSGAQKLPVMESNIQTFNNIQKPSEIIKNVNAHQNLSLSKKK